MNKNKRIPPIPSTIIYCGDYAECDYYLKQDPEQDIDNRQYGLDENVSSEMTVKNAVTLNNITYPIPQRIDFRQDL